jgi:hypothetical protein
MMQSRPRCPDPFKVPWSSNLGWVPLETGDTKTVDGIATAAAKFNCPKAILNFAIDRMQLKG